MRHIDSTPATPEPYYVPTGREPKPKPVSEEFGSVIFNYCPTSATNYVSDSRKITQQNLIKFLETNQSIN